MATALSLAAIGGCSTDDDDSDTSNGGDGAAGSPGPSGGSETGGAPGAAGASDADAGESGAAGDATLGGAGHGGQDGEGGQTGGVGGAGDDAEIAALSDAQILLVLDTLNHGEVEQAYAALPRLMNADVQAFAQQMIVDHGTARQSVAETAEALSLNPEPSEKQMALKAKGESQVELLRDAPATNLDQTYIDLQVAAHTEALALLASLRDAADAPALTTLITTLETAVHDHHDSAITLQTALE